MAETRTPGGAAGGGVEGPPARPVRARTPLSRQSVVERTLVEPDSADAFTAGRLLELSRRAAREHAVLLRELSMLWVEEDLTDDREENALVVAIALRTTTSRAGTLLRDGHIATSDLPRTLERLEAGDMPADWFDRMLRAVRPLRPAQRTAVDQRVAGWDLASIPIERFRRELRLLVAWYTTAENTPTPAQQRTVELSLPGQADGTACLTVTGPVPEILALSYRLDASARAVQDAQRHALNDNEPQQVPFDVDGAATAAGTPLPLSALRYAIVTGSVLDTGAIEVPTERFRLNVTVSVLSLMGHTEAPGMLEGTIPIPAAMARKLAADQSTWYRVLTDPVTGQFLPAKATPYRPSTSLREHLRLTGPVCPLPGCTCSTTQVAEADHIIEYNHADPIRGGPTSIENLHLVCRRHHRLKTAGRIDPVRGPEAGVTTWDIGNRISTTVADDRDLATPILAQALQDAWEDYQWEHEIDAILSTIQLDDGDAPLPDPTHQPPQPPEDPIPF